MKRRICLLVLISVLTAGAFPPSAAAAAEERFPAVRVYEGQFRDVSDSDWYYENIKALYELGLVNGQEDGAFGPEDNMSVAEVVTMAARLRSLYEEGDSEAGPARCGGGSWYQPYVSYLQSLDVIAQEFEGNYSRAVTRGEMAHILSRTLPRELFVPVNRDVVLAGHSNRNYITDVGRDTPYWEDILLLYQWGILSGVDGTGSFLPGKAIPRCQVAAMVTRLVYSDMRIQLSWDYAFAYGRTGTSLADLVYSDGSFYPAPMPDELREIDADVRYMLSRGERTVSLSYPAGTLNSGQVSQLMEVFLDTARLYVEQTYNNILCSYSVRSGRVTMTFSSSLYGDDLIDSYREATMQYAIEVHDAMWADGLITPVMSDYDKARVYFDWICGQCRYDYDCDDNSMSHSGYNVFAVGLAVCDGYTAAYNLLLKLEGISCTTISTESHIWTIATLDGVEYHIDTTWGDWTEPAAYRYFAMTEAEALARFA